jgi:phosphoserine phosphatase RsbU/P
MNRMPGDGRRSPDHEEFAKMVPASVPVSDRPSKDFKALYRKLENALGRIERIDNVSQMMVQVLESLVREFRVELGFESGRLYSRDGEDFYLRHYYGSGEPVGLGYRVPPEYPPHQRTLADGLLIMRPGDPGFDTEIERAIGVSSTFAAIAVGENRGEGSTYVLAFSVMGAIQEERILYSLTAVRHVVNLMLAHQRLTGILEESRLIQESLLPSGPPAFPGYDIDGRSRPTEIVGGDLYDYIPLSSTLLGVAIADASGHGLPAALMARDVVTGLRMGMDEDLKVVRVIERLNRVIHRATLSSKFISLFYGEFERDGTLLYCNAGHNPPLLQQNGSFLSLEHGGLVLGPNPLARYERGHVHLRTGDTVIMYTDGLIERMNAQGRQFGLRRFRRLLRDLQGQSAQEMVSAIFAAADLHGEGCPQEDDLTVVVVRKT